MPVSVILAESNMLFAEGLRTMLVNNQKIVIRATVHTNQELLHVLDEITADLLLADIKMMALNNPEFIIGLKTRLPLLKIIVTSTDLTLDIIEEVKLAGVHGLILKYSGCDELIHAILQVSKEKPYFPLTPADFSWIKKTQANR